MYAYSMCSLPCKFKDFLILISHYCSLFCTNFLYPISSWAYQDKLSWPSLNLDKRHWTQNNNVVQQWLVFSIKTVNRIEYATFFIVHNESTCLFKMRIGITFKWNLYLFYICGWYFSILAATFSQSNHQIEHCFINE